MYSFSSAVIAYILCSSSISLASLHQRSITAMSVIVFFRSPCFIPSPGRPTRKRKIPAEVGQFLLSLVSHLCGKSGTDRPFICDNHGIDTQKLSIDTYMVGSRKS